MGATFVPEMSVRDRLRQGRLAVVAEAPVVHTDQLYIVWRQGVRHTLAAREVLAALMALS